MSVQEKYKDFWWAAKKGEQRCVKGRRWGGHPILIVVDAVLDSIGLNYFQIVVPRVKRFYENCMKTAEITSFEDLSKLTPQDPGLRQIIDNERVWKVAINISKELNRIKMEIGSESDFAALRFWAESVDLDKWREDAIGRINGVGLVTFQYLRMQAGVDTVVPDKIIKRIVERDFNIKAENDMEFIKKLGEFSKETGYSQTLLCWAIWLKESNIKTSEWESVE